MSQNSRAQMRQHIQPSHCHLRNHSSQFPTRPEPQRRREARGAVPHWRNGPLVKGFLWSQQHQGSRAQRSCAKSGTLCASVTLVRRCGATLLELAVSGLGRARLPLLARVQAPMHTCTYTSTQDKSALERVFPLSNT